jgi:nicotinamidase-related amidase
MPELSHMARDAGVMVVHVVVAFRPGHPAVSPRNPLLSALKANGMAVAGSEGVVIHPAAAAREGKPIVVKHRISPLVGTELETLLRSSGIETLVLAGVHTSGVVLSTVRHGRRPRLLRRPRCRGACDAARHCHLEAGGRRHHGGARRRPAWQIFMNERAR